MNSKLNEVIVAKIKFSTRAKLLYPAIVDSSLKFIDFHLTDKQLDKLIQEFENVSQELIKTLLKLYSR